MAFALKKGRPVDDRNLSPGKRPLSPDCSPKPAGIKNSPIAQQLLGKLNSLLNDRN
jgi:hypothetical protein